MMLYLLYFILVPERFADEDTKKGEQSLQQVQKRRENIDRSIDEGGFRGD